MGIVEFESWEIAEGSEELHHDMIRAWFRYVREHQPEMFQEWTSARYYRQLDENERPTSRYVMLFEFRSPDARRAYKERRKDFTGPYAEYKRVDPYQFFDHSSLHEELWEPHETELWLDFN